MAGSCHDYDNVLPLGLLNSTSALPPSQEAVRTGVVTGGDGIKGKNSSLRGDSFIAIVITVLSRWESLQKPCSPSGYQSGHHSRLI